MGRLTHIPRRQFRELLRLLGYLPDQIVSIDFQIEADRGRGQETQAQQRFSNHDSTAKMKQPRLDASERGEQSSSSKGQEQPVWEHLMLPLASDAGR